jgi:hypothetical protein
MAYLKLERHDAALEDAVAAMAAGETPPEKALYRAALALYKLGRFDECRTRLELLRAHYPANDLAGSQMSRVEQRLREQTRGEYGWRKMYDDVQAGERHLDVATYSAAVAVKPSPGRGMGLFTTRAVKAGELLLCEKAFAYCGVGEAASRRSNSSSSSNSKQQGSGIRLIVDLVKEGTVHGLQPYVVTSAIQKIVRNPSTKSTLLSLSSDSYTTVDAPPLVDGQPVIDRLVSIPFSPHPRHAYPTKRVEGMQAGSRFK